jgi:hypothetical protein
LKIATIAPFFVTLFMAISGISPAQGKKPSKTTSKQSHQIKKLMVELKEAPMTLPVPLDYGDTPTRDHLGEFTTHSTQDNSGRELPQDTIYNTQVFKSYSEVHHGNSSNPALVSYTITRNEPNHTITVSSGVDGLKITTFKRNKNMPEVLEEQSVTTLSETGKISIYMEPGISISITVPKEKKSDTASGNKRASESRVSESMSFSNSNSNAFTENSPEFSVNEQVEVKVKKESKRPKK